MADNVTKETAQLIVIDFLKKRKNTSHVDISTVEKKRNNWIFRGTCPINLEGHPWAEKFEVMIDPKGRVKLTDFALL